MEFKPKGLTPDIMLRAVEAASTGIVISDALDDHKLMYVNPAFERITGYSASDIIGKNCRFLQNDDRDQEARETIREALAAGMPCQVLLRNYKRDGRMFWNELNLSPVRNEEGVVTHFIGVQKDITLQQQYRKKVEYLSSHDELTKAYNRYGLYEASEGLYAWAERNHHDILVVQTDIDNMKEINDCYGHAAGDEILVKYVNLCLSQLRSTDVIARMGGDEFIIITHMEKNASNDLMIEKLDDIGAKLSLNNNFDQPVLYSYGLARSDSHPLPELDALIHEADEAMYAMKMQRKGED